MAFNLIWIYEQKVLMKEMLTEIEKLKLPAPRVGHRFDFSQMGEALALFQSGKTTGKVVLNRRTVVSAVQNSSFSIRNSTHLNSEYRITNVNDEKSCKLASVDL